MRQLIIPMPSGDKLVVENNEDFCPGQIAVGIMNKDNDWVQDLVVVEPAGAMDDEPRYDEYNVYIWGDPDYEDWTDKFSVGRIKEKE